MALDKIRAGCLKIQDKHFSGINVTEADVLKLILSGSDQDRDRTISISEFVNTFGAEIRTEGETAISNQELEDLFCKLTSGTKGNPGTLPIDDLFTAISNPSADNQNCNSADNQKHFVIMREMIEEGGGEFNLNNTRRLFNFLDKDGGAGVDKNEFIERLAYIRQFREVTASQLGSLFSSMLRQGTTELHFLDVYLAICPKLEEQQISKIRKAFTDKAKVQNNLSVLAGQVGLENLLTETEPPKEPGQMAVDFFTCIRFEVPSEAFDDMLDHNTE